MYYFLAGMPWEKSLGRWPSIASSVKWKPYHALLGVFGSENETVYGDYNVWDLVVSGQLNQQNCLLRLGSLLRGRALGKGNCRNEQSWHQRVSVEFQLEK